MPLLVNRFTGSTVNVPDDKVDNLRGFGFEAGDDKAPAKKTAKKSAAKKS